jgi:hypothetical protein
MDPPTVTQSNPEQCSAGAAETMERWIGDADLRAIVAAWEKLPPDVRQAIARLAGLTDKGE